MTFITTILANLTLVALYHGYLNWSFNTKIIHRLKIFYHKTRKLPEIDSGEYNALFLCSGRSDGRQFGSLINRGVYNIYTVDYDISQTPHICRDLIDTNSLVDFPNSSMDYIIFFVCNCHCKELLESEKSLEQILEQSYRILKPEGKLYIKGYDYYTKYFPQTPGKFYIGSPVNEIGGEFGCLQKTKPGNPPKFTLLSRSR